MPSFINTFPPGASFGSFTAGVGPVGAAPQPAAPGEIFLPGPNYEYFKIGAGMLPMQVEMQGPGAAGTAPTAGTSGGGGGGGGGYAKFLIPDGFYAPGTLIHIGSGDPGNNTTMTSATGASMYGYDADPSLDALVPGAFGGQNKTNPRGGGGTTDGEPIFLAEGLVQIAVANGHNGAAGGKGIGGDGGDCGGPYEGIGGAGSKTHIGHDGVAPGGGGGGCTLSGGPQQAGNGALGWVRIKWPPD